jgi:hypothetical protein
VNTFKKTILILGVSGLGAVLGFFAADRLPVNFKPINGDIPAIMKALTQLSDVKIPREGLHCEVNGTSSATDGMSINNDVLVGDFIAHYLSWSLPHKKTNSHSLICDGKGIQQCTWSFGDHKPQEGWDRILQFKYNQATGLVDPASLECIDVP